MQSVLSIVIMWVLGRMREPSSWAGIAALISGANLGIDAASATQALVAIGSAVAGLIAIVVREKTGAVPVETRNDYGA